MKDKIAVAVKRLDDAIREYKPIAIYGMFSGGHDSFSASYIAMQCNTPHWQERMVIRDRCSRSKSSCASELRSTSSLRLQRR
jgi:hypothetical protein